MFSLGNYWPFCEFYPFFKPTNFFESSSNIDLDWLKGNWYQQARKANKIENWNCCQSYFKEIDSEHQNHNKYCIANSSGDIAEEEDILVDILQNTNNSKYYISWNLYSSFYKANYWILDYDKARGYLLIGEPCKQYLWIFSKVETADMNIVSNIIKLAKENGYDTSNIIYRPHNCYDY